MAAYDGHVKIHKVMGEFKRGSLHSGSSTGPKVTNRKQAVAIAMNEAAVYNKHRRVVKKRKGAY